MISRWRVLVAVVAILVGAAVVPPPVGAQDDEGWFVDPDTLPFDSLPEVPSTTSWGILGNAGYRVEIPETWNGDLVMWAHGFRGEGLELTVDNPPIREHLLRQGYAWAASSYEENAYNVLTGVESTKALADHADAEILPAPAGRTYVFGYSMGGHITGVSIERYPHRYDGALPACGVMGDYELFDYFLDYNLAAQELALGESTFPVDPAVYYPTTVPAIKDALTTDGGQYPADLNETGEQFKQLVELRSGGDRPNFDEAWAFWQGFPTATGQGNFLFDLGDGDGTLPNSDGKSVLDNRFTVYQLDLHFWLDRDERQLNRDILRVRPDWGARRTGEAITGDIDVPVLSLHNLGDLFVPFSMEIDYARDVWLRGNRHLLVQRAIRGVGHCDFTEHELTTAFDDLTRWVETGHRPEGDPILWRRAVAADDYGCRFSDPDPTLHTLAVPCG